MNRAMSSPAFFEYLIRLGDDRLVLGHRLSEWCGHGPILEEDIALANISLDLIGEASLLLKLAASVEGQGRNEDTLAYFRDAIDFRNAYATVLDKWWGIDSRDALGGRFATLPFLAA